jgi:hypothetical protein
LWVTMPHSLVGGYLHSRRTVSLIQADCKVGGHSDPGRGTRKWGVTHASGRKMGHRGELKF